jgi:hypothetical protein
MMLRVALAAGAASGSTRRGASKPPRTLRNGPNCVREMALKGHAKRVTECLLLGVKRTFIVRFRPADLCELTPISMGNGNKTSFREI